MNAEVILALLGLVIWLFPLYRQYKTEYFPFFLVMAAGAPVAIALALLFGGKTNNYFPSLYLLLLTAFLRKKEFYFTGIILSILLAFAANGLHFASIWLFSIPLAVSFLIMLLLLSRLSAEAFGNQRINLFTLLLFVYFCIDIAKLFDMVVKIDPGYKMYLIGSIAQYFFAAAFCFININTKSFKISLHNPEQN